MTLETTNKVTILIVDDNPTNLDVLFEHLDNAGFEILIAEDGQDAIHRTKHTHPDLILLDIMMPGMDGFEICNRIKQDPETKEIPIIFMTALSEVGSKVKGFAVGGVDYITKPFQYEEVLSRVNTHLTMRNLQKDLQTRNEELDAFAHTVAHDLQNPLSRVIGFAEVIAEILAEGDSALSIEEMQKYIAVIVRNSRQMSKIVDALLLLAGVRKEAIILEPLDMASIIAAVQEQLTDMIEIYQPELILPAVWPVMVGYAPWIEVVWANYFSNALKYGGRPPRLELGATVQENSLICFWVRDNGPGLTLQEQACLFTPFTRLHQQQAEGHGLGLSIVQRIIEKLGGQVGVESDGVPGQGSTFSFTLPA